MDAFFQWLGSNPLASTFAVVLLAVLAIVFIVAFAQGREVSFWPPKIGEKSSSARKARKTVDASLASISEGLIAIDNKLREDNFHPDMIIAFSRSSAVLAGMLANHLKVVELMVIPRKRNSNPKPGFEVGYCLALDANQLANKKILVVFYAIESGMTLENGLDFLRNQGLDDNWRVVSLYISPVAKRRYRDVFAVHVTTTADVMIETPWTVGEYHRV